MAKGMAKGKANSKNKRPVRSSAGKRSPRPGFIPTAAHESDSDDSNYYEEEEDGIRSIPPAKRRRSPTPPPIPQFPGNEFSDQTPAATTPSVAGSTPNEVQLTFNVPTGHKGPFVVKLDLQSLLNAQAADGLLTPPMTSNPNLTFSTEKKSLTGGSSDIIDAPPKRKKAKISNERGLARKIGFLDLPGELRNRVYRLLFLENSPIEFICRDGALEYRFHKTAALLATCRQVHSEGRQILYGTNVFSFQRDFRSRGQFYEGRWQEVGWKDIRLFLNMIGHENLSMIRKIEFLFSDGIDYPNEKIRSEMWRNSSYGSTIARFSEDDHLIESLKILAIHTQLEEVSMTFAGRRALKRNDYRFVDNLCAIKADKVEIGEGPRRRRIFMTEERRRFDYGLDKYIIEKMERKKKLYLD